MSVEIDPVELGFRRPFTVEVAQILKIQNFNSAPVAFKVKTTAPKQYCVRPNSGRIEPGHEVEVVVLLQAMKEEPAPGARCRDKFLVQSVTITGDMEFTNVQEIWDTVDKANVQERKIRVNWLAALDDSLHPSAAAVTPVRRPLANGTEATPDAPPPSYSSPSENSVATGSTPALARPEKKPKAKREPSPEPIPTIAEPVNEEPKDIPIKSEKAASPMASATSEGLRQRKAVNETQAEKKPAQTAPTPALAQATRQGTEGVPIQIVAILCLASFLLAYFFF